MLSFSSSSAAARVSMRVNGCEKGCCVAAARRGHLAQSGIAGRHRQGYDVPHLFPAAIFAIEGYERVVVKRGRGEEREFEGG